MELYFFILNQSTHDKKIKEYALITPHYESQVNQRLQTDYLHCAELWQRQYPRFDFAIVDTPNGFIFARLVMVFTCKVGDIQDYPAALIQPMDEPIGRQKTKDKDLRLIRVRQKLRSQTEFIPARAIRRGAVLVEEGDTYGEYYVMDVLDGDMFLRVRHLMPQYVISL